MRLNWEIQSQLVFGFLKCSLEQIWCEFHHMDTIPTHLFQNATCSTNISLIKTKSVLLTSRKIHFTATNFSPSSENEIEKEAVEKKSDLFIN